MKFKQAIPVLYSENVRRSLDYYTQVLQFDNKWEWDDPPTFGGVSKDWVQLFFCEKGQGHPGTWVSIMVKNVDDYYEAIKAAGAIIRAAPDNKEWGLREMLVEDPDGHILRIGQDTSRKEKKSGELPENIVIVERKPTVEEYLQLVTAVGWKAKDIATSQKILEAPLFCAVAEENSTNQAVGCVLLLGDGASFYYVKDMMVQPDWQNKKIGTALMQKLNDWLDKNAAPGSLVGLYTGENLAPFYKQAGFGEAFGMYRRIGG